MAKQKCQPGEDCLVKINRLLESCAETREYLSRCKKAGLDVDREINANEDQSQVASDIKTQFFPRAK